MKTKLVYIASCVALIAAGYANASIVNVTIPDEWTGTNGWYSSPYEDNEVEPGTIANQTWDLEGTFFDEQNLYLVGGWNFQGSGGYHLIDSYGYLPDLDTIRSGDIFVSTGSPKFGNESNAATPSVSQSGLSDGINSHDVLHNNFGYDFVFVMDWLNLEYTLMGIDENSLLLSRDIAFTNNGPADPWRYHDGGQALGTGTFSIDTHTSATLAAAGFKNENGDNLIGDTVDAGWVDAYLASQHFVLTLDLQGLFSYVTPGTTLTTHFTMECGNDNLMGQFNAPVPEPNTMMIFGLGLGAIAIRRKMR